MNTHRFVLVTAVQPLRRHPRPSWSPRQPRRASRPRSAPTLAKVVGAEALQPDLGELGVHACQYYQIDPRNPCQRRGGGVICARPNGHAGLCTGQSIGKQRKTRRETAEGTMDASIRCELHLGGTECRRVAGHTGKCTQYNPQKKTNRGSKYRKLN